MKNYVKIEHPEDCCGCGACVNVCPRNAITMKEDEAGFIFPSVDESLCVSCGKCADVCVFKEEKKGENDPPEVYAAVIGAQDVLMQSSSGGIFSALALAVLDRGGAVFGAAWTEDLSLRHICVENKNDLQKLRGSKYVQSAVGDTFRQVKSLLADGRYVCYCGTPCQIAGLKSYLGKEYENLLTLDLVCHGVPSMKMLRDDLAAVAGEKFSSLKDVRFRDKRYKWGVKGSLVFDSSSIKYDAGTSPYYFYFLKGGVYRESCYHCRFPGENRQGDITLGDYWGIRKDLLSQMGDVDPDKGVSCVLVNTEKGKKWFASIGSSILSAPSDRQSAERRNSQLTRPSVPLPEHKELRDGYVRSGYSVFRTGYKKHRKDHLIRAVKNVIPSKIKRQISEFFG